MARPQPKNPKALAALIRALRAYAREESGPEFETAAVGGLRSAGVDKAVAQRLVERFDRINPSLRERALGEFAEKPVERGASTDSGRSSGRTFDADDVTRNATRVGGTTIGGSTVESSGGPRVSDGSRVEEPAGGMTVSDGQDQPADATYGIKYVGFYCDDETTFDMLFSNSDEVYAVTSTVSLAADGSNVVRTEKHPNDREAYDDVDKGEERLGPVAYCWQGPMPVSQAVSLSVIAYERDYGDPDKYRDEIDALVKAGILAVGWLTGAGAAATAVLEALSGTITDAINWLMDTDDDQIDIARTEVLDVTRMDEIGRRPLTPYFTPAGVQTGLITSDLLRTQHSGSGAKYTFGFVVERNPPFTPEVIIV
jgi:hypothetical protein